MKWARIQYPLVLLHLESWESKGRILTVLAKPGRVLRFSLLNSFWTSNSGAHESHEMAALASIGGKVSLSEPFSNNVGAVPVLACPAPKMTSSRGNNPHRCTDFRITQKRHAENITDEDSNLDPGPCSATSAMGGVRASWCIHPSLMEGFRVHMLALGSCDRPHTTQIRL